MRTLGYHYPEAVFIDVDTGRGRIQNVVRDGSLFLEKEGVRLVVTVDANLRTQASVLVTGPAERNEQVVRFAGGIHGILFEQNFYRGKNITLGARINFLDVPRRKWDTIILDPGVKREIKANTLDFLRDCNRLAFYGIPAKRGVLLVGEPGTGKTLVCKALMSISEGVTCIMADAYSLHVGDYISDLYELAQDLAPCIVFIEDIDSISKSRVDFGMVSGPAILTLLAELDGIEEHHRIVTVGTTNYLETIDKAVGQRPSRFDRIIELTRPSLEQRKELVALLCGRITADEDIQDYVARRTDGFTPAQIQEVLFSMVIGNFRQDRDFTEQLEKFGREDVDSAISRVNCRNRHRIGFALGGSNGGHRESTGFEG